VRRGHTGRDENEARGGPIWSAAPQRRSGAAGTAKPRGRNREATRQTAKPRGRPRSRAADREAARQTAKPRGRPRSRAADREAARRGPGPAQRLAAGRTPGAKDPWLRETPPKGGSRRVCAYALRKPALAGVTGRAGSCLPPARGEPRPGGRGGLRSQQRGLPPTDPRGPGGRRRGGPRRRAEDREDARKTPGVVTEPAASTLREPASAGVTGRAGSCLPPARGGPRPGRRRSAGGLWVRRSGQAPLPAGRRAAQSGGEPPHSRGPAWTPGTRPGPQSCESCESCPLALLSPVGASPSASGAGD
jgi:hypothetical protein